MIYCFVNIIQERMPIESKGIYIHKEHLKYHFFMCSIIFLSLLRTVLPINIPVFIHLVIILSLVAFCTKEELFACMCSLLPMLGIMQNRIALLLVAIGVLLRLKKIRWKGLLPLALMIVWEFLHIGQSHLRIYGFLQDFVPLIALTVILLDNDDKECDFGFMARSFSYATLACSFINLLACMVQYGYSIFSLSRLGNLSAEYEDFRGLINPNTNSFICVIAISSLLLLRYTYREKKTDNYTIIGLLVVILLTQSKSALLCSFVAFALYAYVSRSYKRLNSRKMTKIFCAFIGVAIIAVLFSDVIGAVIGRFSTGDISTGRISIDIFYFKHIISSAKYLLFGTGLYNYTEQMIRIYPYGDNLWTQYPGLATIAKGVVVYKPCHLGVLEVVVVWGIPGLLLVCMLIKTMINERREVGNKLSLVPLCVIFIYCLQSGFIGSHSVLHALLIILLGMKYSGQTKIGVFQTV